MRWTLRITRLARLEMLEVAGRYADERSVLAEAFRDELDITLLRIQENPLQYQIVVSELRRARIRRFPCAIVYAVADGQVIVLGCVHGRRDPRQWQDRR